FTVTAVKFCVIEHFLSRRMYGDVPCPVFCPGHYRPVCAASQTRSNKNQTFNNRCVMDMWNCHGVEYNAYVEVSMSFCPNA
ncbi:hypothetical protein JYU34_022792, partial [Plutella xylostella]